VVGDRDDHDRWVRGPLPRPPEGRVLGAVLDGCGVGLFATLSGFVASWFLKPTHRQGASDIDKLRDEIAALRRSLDPSKGV
jgi:hypothetical protein